MQLGSDLPSDLRRASVLRAARGIRSGIAIIACIPADHNCLKQHRPAAGKGRQAVLVW